MDKINLEEILLKNIKKIYMEFMPIEDFCNRDRIIAINAMKEACQEILKLAAENARLVKESGGYIYILKEEIIFDDAYVAHRVYVSKESILNTINQIE